MVGLSPFLGEAEEREIKTIGRLFFKGVNPAEESELKPIWEKWYFFFELFLMIADRQNGNLINLPFDCSAFFQPYKTYKIIQCIQCLYFEKIKEDYENAKG